MSKVSADIRLLTLDELAAILRVSKRTVHRMIKQKKIPAWKVGRQWRFPEAAVHQWFTGAKPEADSP